MSFPFSLSLAPNTSRLLVFSTYFSFNWSVKFLYFDTFPYITNDNFLFYKVNESSVLRSATLTFNNFLTFYLQIISKFLLIALFSIAILTVRGISVYVHEHHLALTNSMYLHVYVYLTISSVHKD